MKNQKAPFKRYIQLFWILFAFPFFLFFIVIFLAAKGKMGYMPSIEVLENPRINLASQVISDDGEVLGSFFFSNQNRIYIDYEDLPTALVEALIATEDIRFYRHSGIDFKGMVRMVLYMGKRGGASTITQQLAKLLFHDPAQSKLERVQQKIKEWVIAVNLEKSYTKQELITMYFNQFDFLYNAVGIHSAARVYFNTVPSELTVEQAAILVGMARNPYNYNPIIKPENSIQRRNVVLSQMEKYGFIEKNIYDSISALPIITDYQRVDHNFGAANYFREFLRKTLTHKKPRRRRYGDLDKYKEDSLEWATNPLYGWCNKHKKLDGSQYDLYTDGLKIYTTINYGMQQKAEDAVRKHLSGFLQPKFFEEKKGRSYAPFSGDLKKEQINYILRLAIRTSVRGSRLIREGVSNDSIQKIFNTPTKMTVFSWKGPIDTVMTPLDSIKYIKHFLFSGFMSMDPKTGYVKTYVGGIDFRYFQYDHVTQGRRQAGSTFKPFLYVLAMQEGYSPCRKVPNIRQIFYYRSPTTGEDTIWSPRPTNRAEYLGKMKTLKWGLATSENNISAWLVKQFNPKPIADIAHQMGIRSYIDPVPPMIYGTSDMSVEEMVATYCTFANKGIYTKPLYVTKIEDKNGSVISTFKPQRREAISEKTAFLMLNLMEGVVNGGTASRLRYRYEFTAQIAGKTGTTQNHADGWFIGITPNLVSGTWVGAEDPSVHFDGITLGQGASMALPIWAIYMESMYSDSTLNITQTDLFEKPDNFDLELDCEEYEMKEDLIEDYAEPEY